MAPRPVHPKSIAECIGLLRTLGFVKKQGTGRGPHPEKYFHPTRKNVVQGDKPFVLITHDFYDELGLKLMKKLQNWEYTKAEIEAALQGIMPTESVATVEVDTEPEEA